MIDQRIPYQGVLRAAGAYFDAQGAISVTLVEVDGGFDARYEVRGQVATPLLVHFSFEELLASSHAARRGRNRHEAADGAVDYEDLMRALGYELEQEGAYTVVLDQVEDCFMLSYQFHSPADGFLLHKQMSVFNAQDRDRLLQRARGRRRATAEHKRGLFSLLQH